jgi:hypothetical protein
MNEAYSELRNALSERLRIVADHELRRRDPEAHLERLKSAAVQLDLAIARLPDQCDADLRHYLVRQSYVKALAWLEGRG